MKVKVKLNDEFIVDESEYSKEKFKFLLREDLRKDLDKKVRIGEKGKVVFIEKEVVDLLFSDGKVHTIEKQMLKKFDE